MTSLTDFFVHPLTEPRPYPIRYLQDNLVYPILVNGIVNPNGPTLTVVAGVRDKTSAPLALVYAYLNPFQSELFIPAYMKEGELATPFPGQILQALQPFQVFSSGVPSLCIPSDHLDAFDTRYLYSHLFANYDALRTVFERLKRFPLNPWDRVTEEIQGSMAITSEQVNLPSNVGYPMSEDDMNALLDIVLDAEHNKKELPAFGYAWKGSIDQQRKYNNIELADNAFQYDDFVPLLAHILESAGYEPD